MSLILNIDTAVETASVCLSQNGDSLGLELNEQQKLHASWLHAAIDRVLKQTGNSMRDVNAVAVTIGPGSYTGLRVGLSAAKGLCYARNLPLITIGTLDLMAFAARDNETDLLCPVIDARRMDVFAALYTKNLELLIPAKEIQVTENSFREYLERQLVLFVGSGAKKLQGIIKGKNARFAPSLATAAHMTELSHNKYDKKDFSDLVYSEPFYLKEFYTPVRSFA